MATQVNHELKTFGPGFYLESGSDSVGIAGKTTYILHAETKDSVKYNQSLHEGSGLSRQYAEKTLQVECGVKNKDNENSYRSIVHHGNYCVNADRGEIRLSGKTIIIEAADELHLLATNKIQIGYPEKGGTKEVLTNADIVHTVTKGGNIGDLLKTSSLFASFAGSFVPGASIASAAAGMFGGATPGGLSLGSLAKTAATAYGGPVAGIAAEAAVNELTS